MHRKHRTLYTFLRKTVRLNPNNAEFAYQFLTLNHEVHRALTDRMRATLGFVGHHKDLGSLPTIVGIDVVQKILAILEPAVMAGRGFDVAEKVYEHVKGPIPRTKDLTPHQRSLIKNSPAAKILLDMDKLGK